MEFIPIFDKILVAVIFADTDSEQKKYGSEWDKIFTLWKDQKYISDFLDLPRNRVHLGSAFFRKQKLNSIQVRLSIYQDAIYVRKKITQICDDITNGKKENLDYFFKPLVNGKADEPLLHSKVRKRLIAIYAIRISSTQYIITGGAIKLVARMDEQDETYEQLLRLRTVSGYLKDQGVFDEDSFYEMILDEL